MKGKLALILLAAGVGMDVVDELTVGSNADGLGMLYSAGKPLNAVYTSLPVDPGLLLAVGGLVLLWMDRK